MATPEKAGQHWLPDGRLRQQLARYTIAPTQRVDSPLRAMNRSVQRDVGVEFQQYRGYQPGDDLRRVDWRAYGRSDRLLVREAEREGRLTVVFVVDLSGSMGMCDAEGRSRFEFVGELVGALAWLATELRHDVMLLGLGAGKGCIVQPGFGQTQLERVLRVLAQCTPDGPWPTDASVHFSLEQIPPRSALMMFSDFLSASGGLEAQLGSLSKRALSITSLQVLLPQELNLPRAGQVRLVECEGGDTQLFDARTFRKDYEQRLAELLERVRRRQVRNGARFVRATTASSPERVLRALLHDDLPGRERLLVQVGET